MSNSKENPNPDSRPLEELTPDEQADRLTKAMVESGNRYGGNPELLLQEHPHRDFRNPPPAK